MHAWNSDNPSHDVWEESRESQLNASLYLTEKLTQYLPNTLVVRCSSRTARLLLCSLCVCLFRVCADIVLAVCVAVRGPMGVAAWESGTGFCFLLQLPALGNHESFPVNSFPVGEEADWLYGAVCCFLSAVTCFVCCVARVPLLLSYPAA